MSPTTTMRTTATTAPPQSTSFAPTSTSSAPPSNTTAMNSDESMKLAIGMALLRSKLSQSQPHSLSTSNALRWKQKAKDRKKEVLRLKNELKHLEDNLRGDLYPQNACCKCYFFDDLQGLSCKQMNHGADHRFSDVLRRRFLRLVRLQKRIKKSTSDSIAELYRDEDTEQLKVSAEFLVDLCEASNLGKTPHYDSLAHQAVDSILGSLNHGMSVGKEAAAIEGIISSLIVHLVKRMSTPMEDECYSDPGSDAQSHVQHIICQLGSVAYVGQRVLLAVCHRIFEQAEILCSLDPFDDSFALIHDSIFVMIQLIELLVSDYLVTWSKNEGFDTSLFEEWASSFLHARKVLQSLERRSVIYTLYMDRVTGELAKQIGQISFLQNINQEIIDNLFT
ncbi:hypothetical protein RND81_07G076900 [Saponaria officinalis]|uniref:Protein MULTIPOLAR SPINDLE 1 n=1 Tax=Saponaria officinalis TaxID=3572 RepID=A0AAW1JQ44_SAPOF